MKNKDYKFKENSFIILGIAVIFGIAVGTFFQTVSADCSQPLIHQYFAPIYSGNTVLEVFRNTFVSSAVFTAIAFLIGTSAVGLPFGIAMLIYRGFGIGVSSTLMFALNGKGAFPAVAIMILPKAMAVTVVSVLAVRELIRSSSRLFVFWKDGNDEGERKTVRLYIVKFIVLIVISIIIAAADSVINYVFSGLL